MLDKPTPQDTEPVLEDLSEEDAYMLSILPMAEAELNETISFFEQATQQEKDLGEQLEVGAAKLRTTLERVKEALR